MIISLSDFPRRRYDFGIVLQGITTWFSILWSVYLIEYFHGNAFSATEMLLPSSDAAVLAERHTNFSCSVLNLVKGCFPKFGISSFAAYTEVAQSLQKNLVFYEYCSKSYLSRCCIFSLFCTRIHPHYVSILLWWRGKKLLVSSWGTQHRKYELKFYNGIQIIICLYKWAGMFDQLIDFFSSWLFYGILRCRRRRPFSGEIVNKFETVQMRR